MIALITRTIGIVVIPATLWAQEPQVQLTASAGGSTQSVAAAGSQLTLHGEPLSNVRYFAELSWASRSGVPSDAFGGAYPYDGRVRPIEVYGEAFTQSGSAHLGVRAGRYRTPFGLYDRSEHGYTGFVRPPLIRYDNYWGISNNFLEGGASVFGGVPLLHGVVSLGVPHDVGPSPRRHALQPVVRVESYIAGVIVGASHMRGRPYERRFPVVGELQFTGVDARYMAGGLQLRGEWISGRPFQGSTTKSWYIDAIYHPRALGPITVLARTEWLDYRARRLREDTRFTGGAKIRLPGQVMAAVNVSHQPKAYMGDTQRTALDAAIVWTVRRPR